MDDLTVAAKKIKKIIAKTEIKIKKSEKVIKNRCTCLNKKYNEKCKQHGKLSGLYFLKAMGNRIMRDETLLKNCYDGFMKLAKVRRWYGRIAD